MSSETVLLPLSSVVRNDSPITYGVVKPGEEDPNGVAFIRSGDVSGGVIDPSALRTITDDVSKQYRRTLLEGGEILVSLVGTPGQAAIVPSSLAGANIARQVALVRVDPSHSTRYVFYCLTSKQGRESLLAHSRGSVQQVINLGDLQTVEIPVPPFAEQQAVAHILGTLDDKIELNRKTNETLEAMAKALFKSWFVDFYPVRAKAEGRPTGLPAEISDLFPDSFEDSELGEIPSGWRVEAVGDISSNFDSKRVPVSGNDREKRKGGYPYYGTTGIVDWIDDYLFDGIYLLIGEDGSVERGDGTAFSQYVSGKIWVNNHAHVLTGAKSISTEHLYLYFQFIQVAPYVTGAVQLKISQGRLNSIPVVVAPPGINDCFSGLIRQLFDRKITVGTEISTLGSLRDALLPRLISGEIRIPDAEKMLEEVGV